MEYLSPEGLRVDGRRAEELRRIKCQLGVLRRADGSAYYEQGNTKALATVYGPREVQYICSWRTFFFLIELFPLFFRLIGRCLQCIIELWSVASILWLLLVQERGRRG